MSDTSTEHEPEERKLKMEEFYFQRKMLFGCTISLIIGTILWIIAMTENRWFIVNGDKGIYVESHKRYFKSSQTGIWRNCRHSVVPTPVGTWVVRNFTTLAAPDKDLNSLKTQLKQDAEIKPFLSIEMPDLAALEELDNSLKQYLFAQWLEDNQKTTDFKNARTKLKSFFKDNTKAKRFFLDPTQYASVNATIGPDLISNYDFNQTTKVNLVIPRNIRDALFDGWENEGFHLIKILGHYVKDLELDANIYVDGNKYVFRPPPPTSKNGFYYKKLKVCTYHNLFADDEALKTDPAVDENLLDMSRAAATFAILTIFIMCMGLPFTVYTFMNPRYMFKRLVGGIHFISGVTSFIVCKLSLDSVHYAQDNLSYAFPDDADYDLGFCFVFGVIVTITNFFCSIMFLWYSKKKKGDKAATEELGMADEPINIGR